MKEIVWHKGFEPVIDKNSKILILGSFPSVKSRQQGFYYGNKQNRFWKVLEKAFNSPVPNDIDGRKEFLFSHNIALWDVIESSSLTGSMDSDLNENNSIPVDLDKILKSFANIELIILNGRKAYNVFKKFNKDCSKKFVYLPSTSPANVRFDIDIWINTLNKK